MTIVEMLEQLRADGLSDTQIGRELGMCPSSINKLRRGMITNPRISTVRGIEVLHEILVVRQSLKSNYPEDKT